MLRPLSTDQRLLAPALIAVLVLLAACEDEPDEDQIGKGDEYVAIGDSYTAAPSTGEPAAQNFCQQTVVNYPHQIADAIGLELQDHSCNGANTSNVVSPQTTVGTGELIQDPQIDGIDEDTDLVTFRLGANDFGLIARTFGCATAYAQGTLGSSPNPCSTLDATTPQGPADDLADDLVANVQTALETISDRAPNARIVVIGYPQILPPSGSCDLFPLPPGDEEWARGIIDSFNDALREGADAVDATYIDMFEASAGHDTCSDDPWMAGIQAPLGDAAIWHPYPKESEMVAELVLEELDA